MSTMLIARWVSILAHPFVMVVLMVGAATEQLGAPGQVVRTVGVVALFTILPIVILTIWQVRRGAWMNVDASNPRDRPLLFTVAIVSLIALVGYLVALRRHSFLLRGSTVTLVMLVVCAIATRWVKVSLHMAAAGLTATALILLGSAVGWFVAGVLPFLAWSRFALGRHTVLEVALGLVFGVIGGLAVKLVSN